ncbi:PIH1 domain-containing protein 2 isoform 1-T6 [Anomaloglossus baeobatrachus]|uniref:PIH1 domain-containing protein 2 n=1 Tax=Anomaloglossus baeobatrachus TaxID=238106 RepID=UPI003F508386
MDTTTGVTPDQLLSQVNQFWSMLDDMAENNPQSYQNFIQRHLQEGKDFMAPPEPHWCLQTKILDPDERLLFINICEWRRVPSPESDGHPVPLVAGELEDVTDGAVISIAYSPKVLKKADEDPVEKDQLIRLAMKYIEQQLRVALCHSYRITPFKLKGAAQQMRNSLERKEKKPKKTKGKTEEVPDRSLLEQLRNITMKEEEEKPEQSIKIMTENKTKPKVGLIEVMSSTELSEEQPPAPPQHELTVIKDGSGKPHKLILTAQLQGVRGVSSCDLSVSRDDLLLEVPGKYRLCLDLPESVNEDSVTAKYNKANSILTVSMSVL